MHINGPIAVTKNRTPQGPRNVSPWSTNRVCESVTLREKSPHSLMRRQLPIFLDQRVGSRTMNHFTNKPGLTALLAGTCTAVLARLGRSTGYLRQEILPFVLGTSDHAKRNVTKILVSWGCLALAVVLVSRPCSSGQRLIETQSWTLTPIRRSSAIAQELSLYVVPTHKSGNWSNSIYLTTDPNATWQDLQQLSRNVEKIEQWQGTVLIERITNKPGPQWDISQWGNHGSQIDRFVIFGDTDLIVRINQSVVIAPPRCAFTGWMSSK